MKTTMFIFVSTLLFSISALALPVLNIPKSISIDTVLANYDFNGIVALDNCSGSIIKLEGMSDNQKAFVLTNGHCIKMGSASFNFTASTSQVQTWGGSANRGKYPAPGEVLKNISVKRLFTVLSSDAKPLGKVMGEMLVYATMTKTDMAIYRLKETYSQIKQKFSVTPLMLADSAPASGEPIEVISGYWKRGYSCSIEDTIYSLKEGGWLWKDSLRYSPEGCDIIGGTSGSPVVSNVTRKVIGVNNTANEGREDCSVMNPCEIDENGQKLVLKKRGYAQQTHWLYECLDANFNLSLERASCKLAK